MNSHVYVYPINAAVLLLMDPLLLKRRQAAMRLFTLWSRNCALQTNPLLRAHELENMYEQFKIITSDEWLNYNIEHFGQHKRPVSSDEVVFLDLTVQVIQKEIDNRNVFFLYVQEMLKRANNDLVFNNSIYSLQWNILIDSMKACLDDLLNLYNKWIWLRVRRSICDSLYSVD